MKEEKKTLSDIIVKYCGVSDGWQTSYTWDEVEKICEEYAKLVCLEYQKFLLKTDIGYESVYTEFLEEQNKQPK